MSRERNILEVPGYEKTPQPLSAYFQYLSKSVHNPDTESVVGEISPSPLRDEIWDLLSLPYEVLLYRNSSNRIDLFTGIALSMPPGIYLDLVLKTSNTVLHTHPFHTVDGKGPSIGDVLITEDADPNTKFFVANIRGITEYGRPKYDPIERVLFNEKYVRFFVQRYFEELGIDYFGYGKPNLRWFGEFDVDRRLEISDQFAEDVKSVVNFWGWDEVVDFDRLLQS